MSIEDYKNIAQASQGLFTSLAIIIGGIWTYFIFIKNRSNYPIINLNLLYVQFDIPDGKCLIHASVEIKNNGLVLLESQGAELRLRQVKPLPDSISESIKQDIDPVPEGDKEVEWPLISERRWKWEKKTSKIEPGESDTLHADLVSDEHFEIEPGESDTLHADFVLDKHVEVIEFYFYLKNNAKSEKQLGWALTKMSELQKKELSDD